jgi:hypothetical protein
MATGYEVVHETITTGSYSDPPQQVDAPTGKFVVNAFHRVGSNETQFGTGGVSPHDILLDGNDRITGVQFLHTSVAYEIYLICVDG